MSGHLQTIDTESPFKSRAIWSNQLERSCHVHSQPDSRTKSINQSINQLLFLHSVLLAIGVYLRGAFYSVVIG